MSKGVRLTFMFSGFLLAFILFCYPIALESENVAKGNIVGFVYDMDGTTPLEGAVVKVKNISTDVVYESTKSDILGIFKIKGLENGIYLYGVMTPNGDFNSDGLVGIRIQGNETAKMSISLTPYEKKVASSMQEFYQEQEIAGEAFIGRIVDYNTDTRVADVFIVKGYLQIKDKIHAKGEETDFYQKVNVLKHEGSTVKKAFAGQTASIGLTERAEIKDSVYVVCKKQFLPLFFSPLGVASIVAGSAAIIYGITEVDDILTPASAFKK